MTRCQKCNVPLATNLRNATHCFDCRRAKAREIERERHRMRQATLDAPGIRQRPCETCKRPMRVTSTSSKRRWCDSCRAMRSKLEKRPAGPRLCADCGETFHAIARSSRQFCDPCGKRRMGQPHPNKVAHCFPGSRPEGGMTPGEIVRFLDLAREAETAPPWEREQLRIQMEQMRRRAQ